MIDRQLNFGRHLVRRFLARSAPYRLVLDLGAGRGDDLAAAREAQPDSQLHAVEVYPPNIQALRGAGVTVWPLDLERERLPVPDGSVDVVIANQVLEHVKEIFWIMHEVSRVLRVGGRFIIGVPNLASLHNRLLLLAGRQPTPINTASAHVRGYTRHDLLRFLNAGFPGGYELREWGGSNFYPFPPVMARPLAAVLPGMAWGLFLLLEKRREYVDEFVRFPVEQKLETNFFVGG